MSDPEMDVTTVFARNPRGSLYFFDDFTLFNSTFANNDDDDDDDDVDETEDTECSEDAWPPSASASRECMYCGLRVVGAAVMCLVCGKWFCNGRNRTAGSHIVHHLVRSKHKQVMTHLAGPLGRLPLECYECKSKNVFRLGFVTVKGAAAVVLKCRGACTDKKDRYKWRPVIEDHKLVQWIAVSPTPEQMRAARPVAMADVVSMEEAWNRENEAAMDLGAATAAAAIAEMRQIAKVKAAYADGCEYLGVFEPLVQLEADCDKLLKEGQHLKCVLESEMTSATNGKTVIRLRSVPNDIQLRMCIGEELWLQHSAGDRRGTIIQLSDSYERMITMETKAPVNWPVGTELMVRPVWKRVPFDRMLYALKKFAYRPNSVSPEIRSALLGRARHRKPSPPPVAGNLRAPGLPELNGPQTNAIRHALGQCVSLVHGPPGTGKTVTCATIVYHLAKLGSVLVCAPSNTAADHLTAVIAKTGVRVVRMITPSLEAFDSDVSLLCVHNKIIEMEGNDLLKDLQKIKNGESTTGIGLSKYEEKTYRELKMAAEIICMKKSQVVCTTCSAAGDSRLEGFSFRSVVVDESVQATEPECMIPVVRGARQLVLIGDQCQLGPVIVSKKACKAGLNQSLFERLIRLGVRPARLEIQYRMHPELSKFPSSYFYDGSLQNGVRADERSLPSNIRFPWPNPDKPLMFYASTGAEELSPSGTSYLNRWEADYVERIAAAFLAGGLEPEQIGIITPYEGQRTYLAQTMMSSNHKHPLAASKYVRVEIASVDSFQGREKDLIIVSCVRSNENQGVGFLNDPRRMNVALTRAKYGLVLVGNPHILCKHPMWHSLLCYYSDNGALVEGPLNNMSPANVRLTAKAEPADRRAQSDALRRNRPKPVRRTPQIMGVPESMIFAHTPRPIG
ncbi:regulator of nonsense transcripts 1 homolog [Adelges cooleyi]|uniref:regulator of nonsense transcripts 1 homolog n=1 Tax=Adelges cooleyi TaxID=133065 RepID=UPI002180833C|nr:regulator of nonsense transcripts 1 homolog [Adelges cooleyi]